MKKSLFHPGAFRQRRGVAILIVVGLMSILFISAVAFTIMMRTERAASGSYRQTVASRQLLHAGLMQAIADMAVDQTTNALGNGNGFLGWNRTSQHTIGVQVSTGSTISARILSADLMKYIPANLQNAVMQSDPHWNYVQPTGGAAVGRYAYVAVNVSSLLDANYVNNPATNRLAGSDPGEIQLDPAILWDVLSVPGFTNDRAANGLNLPSDQSSYQSLKELSDLSINGVDPDLLSHFETFSYALDAQAPDLEPDNKTYYPKLYLGGDLESRMGQIYNPNDPPAYQLTYGQRLTNILLRADMMGYQEKNYNNALGPLAAQTTLRVNSFVNSLLDYIGSNTLQRGNTATGRSGYGYPVTKNVPMLCWVYWKPTYSYKAVPTSKPNPIPPGPDIPTTNYTFTGSHDFSFAAYCPATADTDPTHYQAAITVVNNSGSQPLSINATGPDATKLKNAFANVMPPPTPLVFPVTLSKPANVPFLMVKGVKGVVNYTTNSPPDLSGLEAVFDSFVQPQKSGVQFLVAITNISNSYGMNIVVECVPASSNVNDGVLVEYFPGDYPSTPGSFPPIIPVITTNWSETIDPRINWDTCMIGGAPQNNYNYPPWRDSCNLRKPLFPGYTLPPPVGPFGDPMPKWAGLFGVQLTQNPAWLGSGSPLAPKINITCDCVGNRVGSGAWHDPLPAWNNDQPPWFFIANRPLQSVGELGYIPLNYWQTVRLYDHQDANSPGGPSGGFHHVLDYFTLAPPTNTARHGLINLNTCDPAIWGALLKNMPLDENFPNYNNGQPLSTSEAANLGTNIANVAITNTFTWVSDLGKIPFLDPAMTNKLGAGYEIEREAVIRNTAGLLTTRQQIMTIIVEADTLSTSYGWADTSHGAVQGSTMGVFQVWRDSQPDPTDSTGQQHRFFIHMYKVMTR